MLHPQRYLSSKPSVPIAICNLHRTRHLLMQDCPNRPSPNRPGPSHHHSREDRIAVWTLSFRIFQLGALRIIPQPHRLNMRHQSINEHPSIASCLQEANACRAQSAQRLASFCKCVSPDQWPTINDKPRPGSTASHNTAYCPPHLLQHMTVSTHVTSTALCFSAEKPTKLNMCSEWFMQTKNGACRPRPAPCMQTDSEASAVGQARMTSGSGVAAPPARNGDGRGKEQQMGSRY